MKLYNMGQSYGTEYYFGDGQIEIEDDQDALVAVLPTSNERAAEYAALFAGAPAAADEITRLRSVNAQMLEAINRALDYIDDHADVKDGPDGEQMPNTAMSLAAEIRATIAAAEAK